MNCGVAHRELKDAVNRKLIIEDEIDQAVIKLFRARFELGLFDPDAQVAYAQIPMSDVDSEKN